MINFACISPHPPIILPSIGSTDDRLKVQDTIRGLQELGRQFRKSSPQQIIISSPHSDWGFDVPLHFLNPKNLVKIEPFLTDESPPANHFQAGKKFFNENLKDSGLRIALIASGDLSHRLKIDGPYGLHPDGAKFDKALLEGLKTNDIGKILELDNVYPEAGECGLRSFCFLLGILEGATIKWRTEIMSYEAPFGVGYLVANFKLEIK